MTPSDQQMRILRLLVAGIELAGPLSTQKRYQLVLKTHEVMPKTVEQMRDAGWLAQEPDGSWTVTPAGRQLAESSVFVRDFMARAAVTP